MEQRNCLAVGPLVRESDSVTLKKENVMSNDDRYTDLRPLGEEIGNAVIAKAEKREQSLAMS